MFVATNEESKFTSLKKEAIIPLLRISLKLRDGKIVVDEVYRTMDSKPSGEIKLGDDVPASVIGHWVEITANSGEVIYRQYVQKNLPLNAENVDSRLQRIYSLEKYRIQVPDLPAGSMLTLYEQSLPAPGSKTPIRKIRLKLGLVNTQTKITFN